MLVHIQGAKIWFNEFWVGVVKNGCDHLVYETLNLLYLKNEFMNWADFLQAVCDGIIFG